MLWVKTSCNIRNWKRQCHREKRYPKSRLRPRRECSEKVKKQIKRRTQYSKPTAAIANKMSEKFYDYAVQPSRPKKDNLLRTVYQKRQKELCAQIPGPTDRHFDVLDEFAPFFRQDTEKHDNERILIIGNATMKNFLNLSNTWLVDGICKLLPGTFSIKFTQSM